MVWIIKDTYDGEMYIVEIVKKSRDFSDVEIIYTKNENDAKRFFLEDDAVRWARGKYGKWSSYFETKHVV